MHDLEAASAAEVNAMAIPHRGRTGHGTYFITANCYEKKSLLQSDRMASLFIEVLLAYRDQGNFLVHEFVAMPDHFHGLITPSGVTLERSMKLIKGGFSFRAAKLFNLNCEIWQTSFLDRRVRDHDEYSRMREYIRQNPVKRGLANRPEQFPHGSASGKYKLDDVPQRLKPLTWAAEMQG